MDRNAPDNDSLIAELDSLMGLEPSGQPASGAPRNAGPTAALEERAPERTARVLIIDDNRDYREVVKYVLKEEGYLVDAAEDGAQGLARMAEIRPDLVIVDFNMPEKNGYEVIQTLRSDDNTRKIPIVMFTGAPNRRELKSMNLDINGFLEKPISNSKLISAVADALYGADAPPPPQIEAEAPEMEPSPVIETSQTAPSLPPAQPQVAEPEQELREESAAPPPELHDLEKLEEPDLDEESEEELLVDIENEDKHDEEAGLEMSANDSPLVNRVNKILVKAVSMKASDVHIEPQENNLIVRVRLNGSLKHLISLPSSLGVRVAARIKIMSDLVITERRLPQDGQFRALIAGSKVEFRVSTIPSTYGEKIVIRVLGSSKIEGNLGDIGLIDRDLQSVERSLATPHGLVLVTGPTGSGKTTTLYTMLGRVNKPDVNVMTAEDPVEYRLPGITQTHIKPGIGLSFESVLRSFLRQDPDVMLVGEIRDLETAEIAIKASITGHLVLSTLHTNSAPATVARLTHMGLAPFLVAASVKLIVAQRLIKVLCDDCKMQMPLSADEGRMLTDEESNRLKSIYRGIGCDGCHQTGYTGRRPIFEVMPVGTSAMRQIILSSGSADQLSAQAVSEGMTTLREAALRTVAEGSTSLSEALKIILAE